MELNVNKIRKRMKQLRLTYQQLADMSGLESRQMAWYYLKSKSIKGAEPFARALRMKPKDLIK